MADLSEITQVDTPTVACDGNSDEPGHPRVFLNLDRAGETRCPYCSRRFVLKASPTVAD